MTDGRGLQADRGEGSFPQTHQTGAQRPLVQKVKWSSGLQQRIENPRGAA